MTIRDDFKGYVDGNDLLAPNPTDGIGKGSDNGPMFTSEYFVMLKKNGALVPPDVKDYETRILSCIKDGLLNREPNEYGQEGPDDYYGVTNGCIELGITSIPRTFLWSLIKRFGFLDNSGVLNGSSFLARQPQLITAFLSASFPSLRNPLHYVIRLLVLPLYIIAALVLLVSCINTDSGDTDARRLAWHLGNNVSKVSLLCWLAYKVWLRRLHNTYPNDMKGVAELYYKPNGDNPYSKWWVT